MGVPGLDDPHRRLDDRHARLDQPPRQQQRPAEQVPAVAVDEARVFAVEVQRPAHLARCRAWRGRRPAGRRTRRRAAGTAAWPQQVAAAVQALRVEPVGQGEAVVAGLGSVRVEAELPGVVPGAEEPGVLARPGERALDQAGRQGHAVGDAVAPAAHAVEHGRVAGEIVARGDPVEVAAPRADWTAGPSARGGPRAGGSPRGATSSGRSPAGRPAPPGRAGARRSGCRAPPCRSA